MWEINKIKELFLDIFFPPICINCNLELQKAEKEVFICEKCRGEIFLNTSLFCAVCKSRLPDNRKHCHKDSKYLLAAATNYDGAVKTLIHYFKYRKWRGIQKQLGELMINYLKNLDYNFSDYAVIPIPLHKERQTERGFNQSELLAKIIADNFSLPLLNKNLKRTKSTEIQAKLKSHDQREQNIKNCFSIENPELVKNKNIILIDDVHTSGATMNEAVKTLNAAGAKNVIALVVAKT